MSELKHEIITAEIAPIRACQSCMLCENTRELPVGMHYCNTPWVCDECKKAIAFIKELMNKRDNFDPLEPILD